jgi:hypothetical protein
MRHPQEPKRGCNFVKQSLTCPNQTSNINPVMKIGFPPADPTMDLEDHPCFDDTYEDRLNVLFVEAITYIKNNLH